MPLRFNTLLHGAQIELGDVRMLRHQDHRADKGRSPYELWRDALPAFNAYQETQRFGSRAKLRAPYWASFVVTPAKETLLVGFYACRYVGVNEIDRPWPHAEGVDPSGTCDVYELTPDNRLHDLAGRLVIEWGDGERAWIQRPDRQDKIVVQIRDRFREPDFPGFTRFVSALSKVEGIPSSWAAALKATRGVYLLTCPRTREQYVGSATGSDGFLGRWLTYVHSNHGGNVGLKSREPSDYQVSILEVAGSSSSTDDVLAMEALWKVKLQSREMGLNRN
jgi:hypothetical protein